MKFSVNQQDIQKSLNYCQGVIEKRSTLPILSNVLLDASNSKLKLTATDLDVIFIHEIENVEIQEEGKTTTSSSIMYDIIRKISSGRKINFSNINDSKLNLESENSVFNLNCSSFSQDLISPLIERFDKVYPENPTLGIDPIPVAPSSLISPPEPVAAPSNGAIAVG